MKKYLIIFLLCLAFSGYAQTPVKQAGPTQSSIVKDAAGTVYPYDTWRKMMAMGEYFIKAIPGSTEFLLYPVSAEEKEKRAQRIQELLKNMKPPGSDVFKEGEKFSGEKMTDINGNKYDLSNIDNKTYVINFWFIDCAPCRDEMPELNKIVKQYKDNKDVVFLAIALDQRSELKSFLKKTPFDYNIVDGGKPLAHKYGIKGYPTHVIVGKDGLIKFSTTGFGPGTVHSIEKTIKEQVGN